MKKYCFNCNQENDYYVKKEKVKHVIHGVELNIEQDNYYCSKCDYAVTVMVRFRKTYEGTEIKKLIKPITIADSSAKAPESQENK